MRVLESGVVDGFGSKSSSTPSWRVRGAKLELESEIMFEVGFESSISSSSCRVRVRVGGPEFVLPR